MRRCIGCRPRSPTISSCFTASPAFRPISKRRWLRSGSGPAVAPICACECATAASSRIRRGCPATSSPTNSSCTNSTTAAGRDVWRRSRGCPNINWTRRPMNWRLHVFAPVDGLPGAGVGTVAVLQATHVLGDGIRSSALAAWLFGRAGEVPPVPAPPPFRGAALPWRSLLRGPRASTTGCATPMQNWFPRRRIRARRCRATHARTVFAASER